MVPLVVLVKCVLLTELVEDAPRALISDQVCPLDLVSAETLLVVLQKLSS